VNTDANARTYAATITHKTAEKPPPNVRSIHKTAARLIYFYGSANG
jgi:hypothetical protein